MRKHISKFIVSTLVVTAIAVPSAEAAIFTDVSKTNVHYDAINDLVNRGIINGYSDGTFRPDHTLTRGQAAKILAGVLQLDISNNMQNFADVPTSYEHVGAINALYEKGIIGGYSDGTFRPSATLTRGQLAKILVKAFELEGAEDTPLSFSDIIRHTDLERYVQILLNYSITQGTSKTTFSPANAVTRGQMASFITRAEKAVKVRASKEKSTIKVSSAVSMNMQEPIALQINETTTWPATISTIHAEEINTLLITFEQDEQGNAFPLNDLSDTITFSFEGTAYVVTLEKEGWVLSIDRPVAPINVVAQGGNQQITLMWDEVQEATGYIVYRAEVVDGSYIVVGEVTDNDFTDSNLSKGKTYYYKVAVKNGQRESEQVNATANIVQQGPLYGGDYIVISNESLTIGESQSTGPLIFHPQQSVKSEMDYLTVPLKDAFAVVDTQLSSHQVATTYHLGDIKLFNLYNHATSTYYNNYATLAYIGEHAEVWVQNRAITNEQAVKLANEFDRHIYPLVTENFGLPSDIDGNGRIAILCFDVKDNSAREEVDNYIAGYFSPVDLYKNEQLDVSVSNEMEMIYIDTYPTMGNDPSNLDVTKSYATLVHEFQHLVTAVQERFTEQKHQVMANWLDEGLALAAEQMYIKGPLHDYMQYYNESTAIRDGRSLLEWHNADPLANYALSYLFMQYLKIQAQQGDAIFKEIILHEGTEIEAVESIIHQYIDPNLSFGEFMTAFRVALVLKAETGLYGFRGNKDFDSIMTQVYTGTAPNLKAGESVVIQTNNRLLESSFTKESDITLTGVYK
ncbi:S-layer homology domain-containing protein [Lysinibacillus sp. KU-BSD001]|uniref:S-layer homology domain-containing protein n=1 Tax=Lysinibacillus sp. KU-BSD001 TaxID=3141328 RepID=UPI0036EE4D37